METGESSTHLSVSRTSTVDSTASTNSSFEDAQQEDSHEVKGERLLLQQRSSESNNDPGEMMTRPSVGLRETRIIISQDDSVTIDDGHMEDEDEDKEEGKRSESLHKLHQQHALDSWDQEGDSASSSSRSSSTTRISPRLSPSPSHRSHHHQVRHTGISAAPPNINSSISLMCLGSSVMKVKRQGRTSSKMLYLDSTRSYIRWKPSKKGHKAIVNIKNVREIREGACTDTFKKHLASATGHKPSHCFSVIHGTSWESLDIVAGSVDEAQAWIQGLRHLMEQAQEETAQSDQLRDSWLKSVFEAADKSGDGLLSMDEVLKLLHKLNVNLSKRKVKQLFREADTNIDEHLGKLDFDEFVHFYKTLSMRPELYALLREYSCGKEHMTLEDVEVFLRNEQDIGRVNEQVCCRLIEKYEPVPENICNGRLGIDGLMRYLLSEEGDLFNLGHRGVNQDMTQPLSHYYIASSHNTYLLGDQLMSQSSVDVYGLVLQAGCRCVELDTWDGKDGEPVIYHGYTLTSKIKFRDVITVVNKYAFVSSPYPVILSVENHCTLEQQKKMATYLLEILGDQLMISSTPDGGSLPSPDSLKYKILIKAKKLPLDHDADLEAGEVSEEDSADELDEDFKLEKTETRSKFESIAMARLNEEEANLTISTGMAEDSNTQIDNLEKSETRSKFESIAMAQLALMRKKPISPSQQAWQRIAHKRLDRLKALLEATELKEKGSDHKSSKNGRTGLTGTFRKLKATRRRAKLQHGSESDNNSSLEFDRSSSRDDDLEGGTNENQHAEQRRQRSNRKRAFVLSRQLSDLVKYTRSVAFKGFPENMPCWELPSLGEMRANNLAATRAPDFANFTTHNLCRVYPSAYRIDSSNFNPQPLWNCGCQLVALNYQTEGRAMQLLRAKFRANGSCGYVLKPNILRQDKVQFDPTSNNPIAGVQKKQLTIHIISGQQLPKPPQSLLGERGEIIDPYVEVEVVGLNGDCTKAQTKTVQDNGFNPVWDYVVTFPVTLPDLTLVRFVVWDEDPIGRDFIGQATLPFTSLCQGYRHIHLEGLDHATIFVNVTIEDHTEKKYIKNSKSPRSTSITRTTSSPSRSRAKSIETEVSLMTGGSPAHHASPKRRTSLAERLGIRRRHSTTALLVEGIMTVGGSSSGGSGGIKSPTTPTSTPTFGILRQKRRSYEGEMRKGRSQGDEEGCDDVFGDDDCDLIPVDCDAILDRIMSSDVAVELEADGSTSVPLDEILQILRLGISPSQIIQVIQDGRLSLRPALHDVPPISRSRDSPDVDSSQIGMQRGPEGGVISDFEQCDPKPAPTLSRVLDDDLVFPMNNNDISTEMEALLSARFTKERFGFGVMSYDECSSTEDCSSLGSAEDLVVDTLATDHVIREPSGDLISEEGHAKLDEERERRETGSEEALNSYGCKVLGSKSSGAYGILDDSCNLGNQGSDYENQGSDNDNQVNSLCDVVEQDDNVVSVLRTVGVSLYPDKSFHTSNQCNNSSREDKVTPGIDNPTELTSCFENITEFNKMSGITHTNNQDQQSVSSVDYSQDYLQCSKGGKEQHHEYIQDLSESQAEGLFQSQDSAKRLVKGCPESELSLVSQGPEERESSGQSGSLSNVVDSMFDLVASLAEEERELQTLEEKGISQDYPHLKDCALELQALEERGILQDYLPPKGCSLVSPDCTADGERHMQAQVSPKDVFDANGQPRPLAPTGLSPDTPPLRGVSLTSLHNGDELNEMISIDPEKSTRNSSAPRHGPRKKSLVKVLSGLFQKYELFDAKLPESFSKGIRSSLRKRFITRSVPDISNLNFKEEENEVKESDGSMQSFGKKVWSSSNQDISSTRPASKSVENLCGIREESLTSNKDLMFCSDYTDIGIKQIGGISHDPATKMNPNRDLKTNDFAQALREDVHDDVVNNVAVVTEDKAIQTDVDTSSVPPKYQKRKLHRVLPGSWNRDGEPTRPLSCPVLPQETGNQSNKHRIVYFQEQPLNQPLDSSSWEQKNCSVGEGPKEDVKDHYQKDGLDLEDIRVTLANVSSEDPDSGDDAGELSSHICIVKGCNCGVSNLSNLLDSSLLVETCFTGDVDEGVNEDGLQRRLHYEKGRGLDILEVKQEQQEESVETDTSTDVSIFGDGPMNTIRPVHLDGTIDETGMESSMAINSISSIHTHLGGTRRSIGTFRSEYNRSFDDGDRTDDEEWQTLASSTPNTASQDTCSREQISPEINHEVFVCASDLKPIQEIEILEESFSSESIPSTNSTDGTSASENIDTDPELLDNRVNDGDSDTCSEEDRGKGNVTPINTTPDCSSLPVDDNEEESRTVQDDNTLINAEETGPVLSSVSIDDHKEESRTVHNIDSVISAEETRPKSSSSESSFDMFKSLDELSTVLDDELCHGRNHVRSPSSISSIPTLCQSAAEVPSSINEIKKAPPSGLEMGQCTRSGVEKLGKNTVLPRPDTASSTSHGEDSLAISKGRTDVKHAVHSKPPVIGSAISVRFLGQIPRQMSAYSYSDSDSDYDSTTSGSSQETVVEVLPNLPQFARPMVKPPVPPKSPKLKEQLVKQRSREKPPVPPKPQHLKDLYAEKKAKALKQSIAHATSPDTTLTGKHPETDIIKESTTTFNFNDGPNSMGNRTVTINGHSHHDILSTGMLSPGLVHSLRSIPSDMPSTPIDTPANASLKGTESLHQLLEKKYNVTTRKKFRAKPPLEHRHSTGSLFSLADLPGIKDNASGHLSKDQKTFAVEDIDHDRWDQSLESWSLDRKRRSNQRVYFMLNV